MPFETRLLSRVVSAGIAAALALTSGAATAARAPTSRRTSAGAEVRWWNGDATGAVFPIVPFVHYEVITSLFLDFEFALAPQSGGNSFNEVEEPAARLGLGNPMLGAHYTTGTKESAVVWFFGLHFGLPLASLGGVDSDRANDLASATSAHAEFYRWVPELFPIVGTVGFEAHPKAGLWMRLPVDVMVLPPTTDRRELKGGLVARFEIEGQSTSGFGGGGALQMVVSNGFRTRREDEAQAAMEPYFVFDNDRFFTRFGILIALDRPLGFGLEKGGMVSADLRIGGSFR